MCKVQSTSQFFLSTTCLSKEHELVLKNCFFMILFLNFKCNKMLITQFGSCSKSNNRMLAEV